MNTLVDTSVLAGVRSLSEIDHSWAVSVVSIGELDAGVLIATDGALQAERLRRLSTVLDVAPVLEIDRRVATAYGELRAATGRRPSNELWIAATALARQLTLLTADERQAALPLVDTILVG